jgi:hypothetical protein
LTNKEQYLIIEHKLPLFFKTWWLNALCKETDWDVAIVKEGKKVTGVWPYQIEKKYGFKIIRNPLLTPYLGPLIFDEFTKNEVLQSLWEQLPKVDTIQWTCLPAFAQVDFFASKNIDYKQKCTYYIDLTLPEEELWKNIHPKRKNDIRKAEQELAVVKEALNLEAFVEGHQRSFKTKNKVYPYSISFFEKILSVVQQRTVSMSLVARDEAGRCLGQIWLVFDEQKIYYLLSATPETTHRGAIALLIWNAILEARKMGLTTFDFEGSIDAGIANFFQRFGGNKIDYFDYAQTNSPLWKLKKKLLG